MSNAFHLKAKEIFKKIEKYDQKTSHQYRENRKKWMANEILKLSEGISSTYTDNDFIVTNMEIHAVLEKRLLFSIKIKNYLAIDDLIEHFGEPREMMLFDDEEFKLLFKYECRYG